MRKIIFKRDLLDNLIKYIPRREIIGIRGPRQVGKTTILKLLKEKLEEDSLSIKTAYINLDFMNLRKELQDNPAEFIMRYREKGKQLYLFFDEIQNVQNAGMILKILYDEFSDTKIFFSGSSSLEIRKNILPNLVGRLFLFDLYSFTFAEFVGARDPGLRRIIDKRILGLKELFSKISEDDVEQNLEEIYSLIENLPKPAFEEEISTLLREYLVWGGYPEVIKTSDKDIKKTILQNIITLYFEKDIMVFFKIRDSSKFLKLSMLLAAQIGGFAVNSEIASELQISWNTVESYLNILKHSYIIQLLRPYHKNLRNELRKQEKVYFLDNGIRNALIFNFIQFENRGGQEKGILLENFVYRELLSNLKNNFGRYEIKYWRTTNQAEVDFVLSNNSNSRVIPIEVKLGGKKVSRGFYSFIKKYDIKVAFVATFNTFRIEKRDGYVIIWAPVYYF